MSTTSTWKIKYRSRFGAANAFIIAETRELAEEEFTFDLITREEFGVIISVVPSEDQGSPPPTA